MHGSVFSSRQQIITIVRWIANLVVGIQCPLIYLVTKNDQSSFSESHLIFVLLKVIAIRGIDVLIFQIMCPTLVMRPCQSPKHLKHNLIWYHLFWKLNILWTWISHSPFKGFALCSSQLQTGSCTWIKMWLHFTHPTIKLANWINLKFHSSHIFRHPLINAAYIFHIIPTPFTINQLIERYEILKFV